MWKEFINSISEEGEYIFNEPADKKAINYLEENYNVQLPSELIELFHESDGIKDTYGSYLIWSTRKILDINNDFRTAEEFKSMYMPFDNLLFVADAGNGDFFGYSIINGAIQRDDIYVWDHETDSRTWKAPSLKDFIEGWTKGNIGI
ncbi:SMI1/KNR4 family protein [Neobacillus sp. PS3-34]|uniref:SMI1/KNR4 family protein n=1 Tax=Neobacillus sp. PS3-34 TaxID=3070678 RepID=UPI0027E11889|nr:SMI1/KNR4 family protein [Neobacillus sp. PS3-34]WML48476.1 SMI1/KNR4 family protein [Neobacillus sp. PS3-34]